MASRSKFSLTAPSALRNLQRPFVSRNFRVWTLGNAISLIGMWAQRIAVGWLAWDLTGSAFWLGLVAFADLFPTIVIAPIAGVIADRRSRLAIIRVTQVLSLSLVSLLALLSATGTIRIEMLVLLVLLHGITMGFKQPSRMALTRQLVPGEVLPSAIGINAAVFNLARFIGPALAGLMIVGYGVEAVFVFDAVTSAVLLFALHHMHLEEPLNGADGRRGGILGGVIEGVRYVAGHKVIGPLLLLQLVFGFGMRAYIELLPGLADQAFGRGAVGLAQMSAAIGIGAIISGLWLAQRGRFDGLRQTILLMHALSALTLIGLALAPNFALALVMVTLNGAGLAAAGVATQTSTQLVVDERMLGRVMSLYGIIFRAAPALGALLMGLAADLLDDLRTPLIAGASLCLVVLALFGPRLAENRPASGATLGDAR